LGIRPASFVNFIQNHDQVANSARGERAHVLTSPGRYRAMTALLLLAPQTPMLFQGQEFAASAPFLYFADHEPELAELVRSGRRKFLAQFPSLAALGERLDRLTDARIEHDLPDALPPVDPDAALAIYRIAQEGLTNAIRHAGCSRVEMTLSERPGALVLELRDDGRGLRGAKPGIGMRGMEERALLVDAELEIASDPGGGTHVRLELPLEAAA
jgi:signal transduction histidine kinase